MEEEEGEILVEKSQELYKPIDITEKDIVDIVFEINDEERKELEKETKNYHKFFLPFLIENNKSKLLYSCKNYLEIFDDYDLDLRDKYLIIVRILEHVGNNGLELMKNMKEKLIREEKEEINGNEELPDLLPGSSIPNIRKILTKLEDLKIVKYRRTRGKTGHFVYFYKINDEKHLFNCGRKQKEEILKSLKENLSEGYVCPECGYKVENKKDAEFTEYLCPFDGKELIKPKFEEGSYLRKIVEKKIELFEKELNN